MTQRKDIVHALSLGIDAIGLIFYDKSPRNISPEHAAEIIEDVKLFSSVVGVFVNPTKQQVTDVLEQVDLDYLQFHGDEPSLFCGQFGVPYIKAVRVKTRQTILDACKNYPESKALLLDTHSDKAYGGTGEIFDWNMIPKCSKPLIIAGGLNPDNCKKVIETKKAYALDVCSGIELKPGIKDWNKIQSFVNNAWSLS